MPNPLSKNNNHTHHSHLIKISIIVDFPNESGECLSASGAYIDESFLGV